MGQYLSLTVFSWRKLLKFSKKHKMNDIKYLVVGAGIYGSVVAERIASVLKENVVVIDKRCHIGGNSYSEVDPETGIECHKFGSHIFHTSNERVWKYITQFTQFTNYQHKVFSRSCNRIYTMPINLKTLNDYYGLALSPSEMKEFLAREIAKAGIGDPRNLEEKAISMIGSALYEAFIRGYTVKQWNQDPRLLPSHIITRLPVRYNYNNNYYSDALQGMPADGYAKLFERLLTHPKIELRLETSFASVMRALPQTCRVIYTGMVDELLDYRYGPLGWRSLRLEWETRAIPDYQGTSVMNYGDEDIPYTRIHEFKHFHPERRSVFESGKTVICREYSSDYTLGAEAYYPVNTDENHRRYEQYLADFKSLYPDWLIGGRLGAYQYWDMDKTIEQALLCFEQLAKRG